MLQNILDNCCNGAILLKVSKILIFSTLLIVVISEYGLDIYTKFHDRATVFVSKTSEIHDFTLPPIAICIKNKFKPSVMKKYGLKSWIDLFYGHFENKWNQENISIWNTFEEASYLLNRDLEIQMMDPSSPLQLSVGMNYIKCEDVKKMRGGEGCKNGSNILIDIQEYYTSASGTCYGLKSNLQIPASESVSMMLHVNKSLPEEDFPEVSLLENV